MKFDLPNDMGGNSSSSADFVQLKKDQDSIKGVFAGNPLPYKQHWLGSGKRPVVCEGLDAGCKFCLDGQKASFRFRINFITTENKAMVSKIFEQGWNVWKSLEALNKKVELERTTVEITRMGEGRNDTNYVITPILDGNPKLSEKAFKKIQEIPLKDLYPVRKPDASSDKKDDGFDPDKYTANISEPEPEEFDEEDLGF